MLAGAALSWVIDSTACTWPGALVLPALTTGREPPGYGVTKPANALSTIVMLWAIACALEGTLAGSMVAVASPARRLKPRPSRVSTSRNGWITWKRPAFDADALDDVK